MDENDFMNVLKQNDESQIKKFILLFGKKPKPFCPVYFFKSEDPKKGETQDE